MSDDFKKPLDTWIDEEAVVDRPTVSYDPSTKRVDVKHEKVKVPVVTRYTRTSQYASICPARKHHWQMIDKHKHIAACSNCPKRRFIHVAYEKIDTDGHLADRDSGIILD